MHDVDAEHHVIVVERKEEKLLFVVLAVVFPTDDFSYWLARAPSHHPTNICMQNVLGRTRAAVSPFSSRVLFRAADSPLMKNKTPIFFLLSSICVSLAGDRRRRRCSHSFLFLLFFSRALSLLVLFLLLPYTHTHTLSSTSSGLFASPPLLVYVFFTTRRTYATYSSKLF